jgi:hypothetical protein
MTRVTRGQRVRARLAFGESSWPLRRVTLKLSVTNGVR